VTTGEGIALTAAYLIATGGIASALWRRMAEYTAARARLADFKGQRRDEP
jgi:hypothetical protein